MVIERIGTGYGEQLRDRQHTTFSFSAEMVGGGLPYLLSTKNNAQSYYGFHKGHKDSGNGWLMESACKFVIESIEASILCDNLHGYVGTKLRLHIGEKDYFEAQFGTSPDKVIHKNNKIMAFMQHEFKHRPNGTCDCIEINALQNVEIWIENLFKSDQLRLINASLIGTLWRPVP